MKLFFLGLDCAPPKIIYEEYGVELENIREIVEEGKAFRLRSTNPPITIPAWISMFTGRTPGELGIYGFRHRRPGDVKESYIINSTHIAQPTVWDVLGRKGVRTGLVGVPPTYPPRPIRGFLISDFTTPGPDKPYTFPPWVKAEIEERFGPYIFDVTYRSEDKDKVAKELFRMTQQHLKAVEYLIGRKWDLFIYVEIGVDRIHHAFWKYFDEEHPRHVEHPEYSRIIPRYYTMIDEWLGRLRRKLPKDTTIVIASDHGVKPMKGAFVINQWLEEQGYLKLKERPKGPGQDIHREMVDWEHTVAWGWGGYYSRIFVNLKGREPHGIVEKEEYWNILSQLKRDLERVRGPDGEKWANKAHSPYEIYPEVKGDPPDLLVYFDDLSWRAAGTVGWPSCYLPENDRGPDDAVHDWYGVFTVYDPTGSVEIDKGELEAREIYDFLLSKFTWSS